MKTYKTISVKASVETPRVPNFIKQSNGQWIPLCALSDEGLQTLGEAWIDCLKARAKEQSKDPDFFYKQAAKSDGES